tara:strand:- start:133 stop:1068 length:936 start_codon:yes stop_codon:yes gene_type:complete
MTKLCPRGKAAAKRKFAVYPSAYANAYASKICAGKIKDPSGVKRKDFRGPKKAALGAIIGLGAAALGKKLLGKKTKQAMPQKGIGPITTMAEKQAKKRKEFMGMSEGEFIKKPQPPLRNKKNIRTNLRNPREIEYQKKKKAYDTLTGNENKRPRPKRFKKGKAIMIVIGIGKKKKVDKKMGGGMTAGSQSALGRLQKARMMNKGGGADTGTVGEIRSKQGVIFNKVKRMVRDDKDLSPKRRKRILQQVKAKSEERMNRKNIEAGIQFSKELQRGRRELFKSTAGKKIPAIKGGGMLKYNKGGMADYYKDLM